MQENLATATNLTQPVLRLQINHRIVSRLQKHKIHRQTIVTLQALRPFRKKHHELVITRRLVSEGKKISSFKPCLTYIQNKAASAIAPAIAAATAVATLVATVVTASVTEEAASTNGFGIKYIETTRIPRIVSNIHIDAI